MEGLRSKMLKSNKRMKKSKRLRKPNKNTKGSQMTKMNNPLYVAPLVKKLQKIPRGKTRLSGRENNLNRRENRLKKRLPLRERLKNLFKKHGFTIATVVAAVGITIGVLAKILADGASAAANGIKTVGKKVGDGLKDLGKRIGAILPGLVGAIASFVFRAAGQAISFLAKNAWLIILAVAAFMIQKLTEKKRDHFLAQITKPTKASAPRPTRALFI